MTKAYSIEPSNSFPGIITSLETLQNLEEENFKRHKNSITEEMPPVESIIDIKLNNTFLKSLLIKTDNRYLSLIQKDECKLYSLLENGLIKTDPTDFYYFAIKTNELKNWKEVKASENIFFDLVHRLKCLNNKEFKVLFNENNFQKTISSIKFSIPKGENDCHLIHNDWLLNSYTPYLCKINKVLKRSPTEDKKEYESYLSKIPLLQRNYISELCENLHSPKLFCEKYLKNDVWTKILNGERPDFKLNFLCSTLLKKPFPLSLKDQQTCSNAFINNPNICITNFPKDYPSIIPLQNCNEISTALLYSKLNSNYQDCPGNIDNEAMTNIHRIINHFYPRKILTNVENCSSESSYTFARLNLDIKYDKGWPLKICFFNRIENKTDCVPYIPGARENEPLSEDIIVSRILYLQKGAPPKTQCKIVSSKKYNPVRTEFKFGCFIVYNSEKCTTFECEKKVIWEEKEQADIKFIGKTIFEYYPSAFSNERYSAQNLLYEVKNIQSRAVKSLTELKFYMDKLQNGIIHGVGCAEDLIPETFKRVTLNQCRPLPFIIGGYFIKNGEAHIVVHTAIDNLFAPRILMWQNVYNSVATYKELHPLNTWTMHGLKK